MEDNVLRKKSKACWIDSGDANIKFFHDKLKLRTAQNIISSIYTHSGIKLTDPQDVETEFIADFTSLMGDCAAELPYPNSEFVRKGHALIETNKFS